MNKRMFEDKNIAIILRIALGVLIVCIGATFFHVHDIRNVYRNKTEAGFRSNVDLVKATVDNRFESMMSSLSYMVNDYERIVERNNVATSDPKQTLRMDDVKRIISNRTANGETEFYYITPESIMVSEDSVIYYPNLYNTFESIESYRFSNNYVFINASDYLPNDIGNESVAVIYRRLNSIDGKHYYFIAKSNVDSLFENEIFSQINDIGFVSIFDSKGKVICTTDNYKLNIEASSDIFDDLLSLTNLSPVSSKKVLNLKRSAYQYEEGSMDLKAKDAKISMVYLGSFPQAKNIGYMVYFNPGVLDEGIKDGAVRSYIICMFMILIMIGLIMYIWFTMNSSKNTMVKLAYMDDVTSGYNYNYFKMSAPRILISAKETPYFVIRFDVLNFRYINESYGHDKADQVLDKIVSKYDSIFESDNEICVRINSDQYVALAKNNYDFEDKYEQYIREVADAAKEVGVKYPVRLRMGIYQIRKEDDDIEVMIDRANVARKSVDITQNLLLEIYSDKIINKIRKVDSIESDMEKSLVKGEFRVFIQPKWDIVNDKIIGGEALVRWIKDDGTIIYPNDFIPVFESNGFIENLDFYMLEQLCIKMKDLRKEGGYRFFPISVNQSRILISNPDYVRNVEKTLKRFEADVKCIQLEITENVFFDERDKMIKVVSALKELGLEMAMDDFGSGYSSLNILKDIPFDVLKIDKAFFDESILSDASKVILQKILEMASALDIDVICEGVETSEQVEMLKGFGCRSVQGYYYGKPMPMDEFIDKYCHAVDK